MSRYEIWRAVGLCWALVVMGAATVAAQEVTEAWVAEQLGGESRSHRPLQERAAESASPTLSLVIRYRPATGELTPASAKALGPLYDAVHAFAPAPFRIVCCTGLPATEAPRLSRQLVAQLSRLFTDRGRGKHVEFQVRTSPVSDLPSVRLANAARIDVYRLP